MRVNTSSLISNQVPEFVRADYPTFVAFVEAYYEYLDQQGVDLKSLRDLDQTIDDFIKYFKKELAVNLPTGIKVDEKFLLQHIKDQYLAKGSQGSYKLLFRLLYDKNVEITYPSAQMLRASDGRWQQDVSLFIKVTTGTPDLIEGKLVDVVKPNATFKVLVDRRQYVEVEVDRIVQLSNDTYEIFIDRRFFGNIDVGDVIRYSTTFAGTVVATTSRVSIVNGGSGFKVGQLFELKNGTGVRSIVKVTRVSSPQYIGDTSAGAILACEFIKFGIGYSTDFTISLNSSQDYFSIATQANQLLSTVLVNGLTVSITEATNGASEQGYISRYDYAQTYGSGASVGTVSISGGIVTGATVLTGGSNYVGKSNGANTTFVTFSSPVSGTTATGYAVITSGVITSIVILNGGSGYAVPPTCTISSGDQQFYVDGSYVGSTIGTFSQQAISSVVSSVAKTSAILKIEQGALANYPGYYTSNAGFLSDSIFIQDSKYYQVFSYVLKLDERLASYKTAVKSMIHPAGTALFGEYQISNDFNIGAALQSIVRILALSLKDSTTFTDSTISFLVSKALTESVMMSESQIFDISKVLADSLDTPTDATTNVVGKALADSLDTPTDATTNVVGKALADSLDTPTDTTINFSISTGLTDSLTTPTDLISKDMTKYLTDATTNETDTGYVAKNPYSEGGYFAITPIIYDNTIDSTF